MLIVHIYSLSHSVHHSIMNHGKSTLPLLSPHNTHMRHGFNSGAATWHTPPHTHADSCQHNGYADHLPSPRNSKLSRSIPTNNWPNSSYKEFSKNFGLDSYHTGSTLKAARKNLAGAKVCGQISVQRIEPQPVSLSPSSLQFKSVIPKRTSTKTAGD